MLQPREEAETVRLEPGFPYYKDDSVDPRPQDVSGGSLWQTGPEFLSKPVTRMPLKKYDQIFMKKEEEKVALEECYSKP